MKISVIIPTYNRDKFLKRALISVYSQTYKVNEIIVIDDGSTDNTSRILKDFPDVIYIYQDNSGVSSARNLGITVAKNDWIAFLDSDDEWKEKKIEEQVSFHKLHPNILMSYTDEIWIRNSLEVKIPKKFRKIGKNVFLENLGYCNIAPSSVLIHRFIFENIGTFDEKLEVCEDYDLWLRISLIHSIFLLNKKLIVKYAGHDDQLSFKHWGMDKFRVQALEKLLKIATIESSSHYKKIQEELLVKYKLLLKGAIKYNREEEIVDYGIKIDSIGT